MFWVIAWKSVKTGFLLQIMVSYAVVIMYDNVNIFPRGVPYIIISCIINSENQMIKMIIWQTNLFIPEVVIHLLINCWTLFSTMIFFAFLFPFQIINFKMQGIKTEKVNFGGVGPLVGTLLPGKLLTPTKLYANFDQILPHLINLHELDIFIRFCYK